MGARWQALSPRERALLLLAGGVLGALLLWSLVWAPLSAAQARLTQANAGLRQDLATLRPQVEAILAQRAQGGQLQPQRQGRSLLALADSSARSAGLASALKRVEPIGEDSVRVWMDAADFDAMAAWLEKLDAEEAVVIEEWSVDRALAPGVVNARMTLKGAPR